MRDSSLFALKALIQCLKVSFSNETTPLNFEKHPPTLYTTLVLSYNAFNNLNALLDRCQCIVRTGHVNRNPAILLLVKRQFANYCYSF